MAGRKLPSLNEIASLLSFDCETGRLVWRHRTPDMFEGKGRSSSWLCNSWNANYGGKIACSSGGNGYRRVRIGGKQYAAHRVVWLMFRGEWPRGEIDHIDGNRQNNSPDNLRDVNRSINQRNAKRRSDNKSGHVGVYWFAPQKIWGVRLCGQHIGYAKTLSDAVALRKDAEKGKGFSRRHGT